MIGYLAMTDMGANSCLLIIVYLQEGGSVPVVLLLLTCEESQYHRCRCLSISAPLSTTRSVEGCKDGWSLLAAG